MSINSFLNLIINTVSLKMTETTHTSSTPILLHTKNVFPRHGVFNEHLVDQHKMHTFYGDRCNDGRGFNPEDINVGTLKEKLFAYYYLNVKKALVKAFPCKEVFVAFDKSDENLLESLEAKLADEGFAILRVTNTVVGEKNVPFALKVTW